MKAICSLCVLTATLLISGICCVRAEPVYVPNADFAQPPVTDFDTDVNTNMVSWATFPPETDGAIGVFYNLPEDGMYIVNCIGNQAAYIFNDPGLAMFQDYEAADSTGSSNGFKAIFDVGRSYQLTAGIIGSVNFGEPVGASLQMSVYYRDVSNNMITIASTNIIYDPTVFASDTNFVSIELDVPAVEPGDAWAGQHIGIEFLSTSATNLEGGFWDVGDIALESSIYVPNADFGLPLVTDFDTDVNTNMVSWETFPPQTYGAIGVFGNLPEDGQFIVNCIGDQAAYIFNSPGLAFFQDYAAVDSMGATSTNFSAIYEGGKSYHLTAGIIGSTNFGLPVGASLQLSLYYRDASNNMITIASNNIIYDTTVSTSDTNFVTCEVDSATVRASDPWVGQHIGIEFLSNSDTNSTGGFWDVGNVALSETLTPYLICPTLTNGQFAATLLSDSGLVFQILESTNLSLPSSNWTSVAALTNVTGMTSFIDTAATNSARFYEAQQLPSP